MPMPPCNWIGLLADELRGAADLRLGGCHGFSARDRVVLIDHHGGQHRHAFCLLARDQHFDVAVLQHLE